MKQRASHPWYEDNAQRVANAGNTARIREEERLFDEQMHGANEGRNDQRSRHGDYYGMREHEDWSLGNQLEHGARLAPHTGK